MLKTRQSGLAPYLATLTVLLAIAISTPATAQDWSSVPELEPRQHVAVQRGYDGPRYDDARNCFRRAQSRVGANYFGAVVAVTHPEGDRSRDHSQAHQYAAFLAQQWTDLGRMDSDAIAIAIGFRNRSIGVHLPERFRQLDISDELLTETVNATDAPRLLTRGAYADALCAVLDAVDLRLAFLSAENDRTLDAAAEIFPRAKARITEVQARVDNELPDDHELQQSLKRHLESADELLAKEDLIESSPHKVIPAAHELFSIADRAEADLDRYLPTLAIIDELQARIDQSLNSTQAELLATCQELTNQARLLASPDLLALQQCIHNTDLATAESDLRHFYVARVIPSGIAAIALLLLLAAVTLRLRRRQRTLRILRSDLNTWERSLTQAEVKLAAIQQDFPWYFTDRAEFWTGKWAEIDHSIADTVNRASLLKDRGADLLQQARTLQQRSKLLGLAKLEKALFTLRDSPLHLAAGDGEPRRLLTLPLTSSFDYSAADILPEIDAALLIAREGLRAAAPVQQQIADLLHRGESARQAATIAIDARRKRGLQAEYLQESLQAAERDWSLAIQLAGKDPESGALALNSAADSIDAVLDRAQAGNQALSTVEGRVEELRNQIQALLEQTRRKSVNCSDPGFDPSSVDAEAQSRCSEIVDLVASGHDHNALERVQPLVDELELTALRLTVCLQAPDIIPAALSSVEPLAEQLKEPLFSLRMQLKRLDDDTSQNVAPMAEQTAQLQRLMPRLGRLSERIENAYDRGKPLSAIADLTALLQLLETGTKSLASIEDILSKMDANNDSSSPTPPPPAPPIWRPPNAWHNNPAFTWGRSSDADEFRSLSLPTQTRQSSLV